MHCVFKRPFFVSCLAFLLAVSASSFVKASVIPSPVAANDPDVIYLNRIHPDAYYRFTAYSASGDLAQLHDASTWFIHPQQRHIVLSWKLNDDIFIKRTASCFSYYKYVLYNRMTKEAVEANLKSPTPQSPNPPMGIPVLRIINIDSYNRLIQLNDNSFWFVNPSSYDFSQWKVGQRILVGVNNQWRTNDYPQIFINVDRYGEPHIEVISQNCPVVAY